MIKLYCKSITYHAVKGKYKKKVSIFRIKKTIGKIKKNLSIEKKKTDTTSKYADKYITFNKNFPF